MEVTTEGLQQDLARLWFQKHALERELAAVMAHLGTLRQALGTLQLLMADPAGDTPDPVDTVGVARSRAPGPGRAHWDTPPAGRPAAADGTRTSAPPENRQERGMWAPRPTAEGERTYGKLTEQILEHLSRAGVVDVRARDVAAALGRDTGNGSINTVRSALDRLVGASRVRRTGRGLYRAQP
ncbi:hypothetical protein [Streptomyces sp. NPDC017673]|uniref:hypothetical protein n=1 Tax=unclassified Streptomyces TaxID=2593676 RepID=UPI0037A912C1